MEIIKVDAIDSTNAFLRSLNREKNLTKSVCVSAHEQTAGKGQMGAVWQSNPGQNLTCSVFMPISTLELEDQFYISMSTALAIYDVLKLLMIPKVTIKWPNDILSDRHKICGVLIENVVKNGRLCGVIVGIGLNVNQHNFTGLPKATSLKNIMGNFFDLDNIITLLLQKLEERFLQLTNEEYKEIKDEYESRLFRKDKPATFIDGAGDSFVGIIQSVTKEGRLQLLLEDDRLRDYNLKELQLRY